MTTPDTDHRHHAGNHGDVWKHVALLSLLAAFKRTRLTVVDTHAGRGTYHLGPTGTWTAGVGALLAALPEGRSTASGAVDRYVARVRRRQQGDESVYPGSPRLILDALGRNDRLRAHELDPGAAEALVAELRDPRARVVRGDGWQAVADLPAEGDLVVHVDPSYGLRDEWTQAGEALATLHATRPDATGLLWYPVKRLDRADALHAQLREAGVPFVAIELLVSPLEVERRAVAGSGVLLVNAPPSVLVEIHGAAPVLGPLLATHDGRWSLRTNAG